MGVSPPAGSLSAALLAWSPFRWGLGLDGSIIVPDGVVAIQLYQDSDRPEKRLGVTKDEIATVDLVCFLDEEQVFFEDYRKLESFRNDPVIADAVETLHQELDGPEAGLEMGGL